jgi:hypothetical protein
LILLYLDYIFLIDFSVFSYFHKIGKSSALAILLGLISFDTDMRRMGSFVLALYCPLLGLLWRKAATRRTGGLRDDGKQQWRWRWRWRRRRDGPGCPLVHGCRRRKRRRAARRRGHTHGVPLLPHGLLSHGTVALSCPLYPLISPNSAFDSVARQIPDELVEHYLGRSGFHSPDLRL